MEGLCNIKMIPIQEGSMELCMHENHILFLPVNILMVWRAGFLGLIILFNANVGIFPLSYAVIPSFISCFTTFYRLDPYN